MKGQYFWDVSHIFCSVWSGLVTIFPLLLSVSLTKEHLVSFGIGLGDWCIKKRTITRNLIPDGWLTELIWSFAKRIFFFLFLDIFYWISGIRTIYL